MRARFFSFLAILAFSAGSIACDSATSPLDPVSRSKLKAGDLHITVSITGQGSGALTFRVGVENGGPAGETLHFSSGQFLDIEVAGPAGNVLWRWSHDKAFTQALWELELAPGESYAQTATWDLTGNNGQPLAPGSYGCRVWITCDPGDGSFVYTTTLTI